MVPLIILTCLFYCFITCVAGGLSRAPVTKGETKTQVNSGVRTHTLGIDKGVTTTPRHKRWGEAQNVALGALEERRRRNCFQRRYLEYEGRCEWGHKKMTLVW